MSKKPLLVTLLAIAVAALALTLRLISAGSPEHPPGTVDRIADADLPAAPGSSVGSTAASAPFGDAADAATPAGVRSVVDAADGQPLPADAHWLDLLVLDPAGAPLAGADVYWYDDSAQQRIEALDDVDPERTEALRGRPERMIRVAGWRTRSDPNGKARITTGEGVCVAGVHGDLYACITLLEHVAAPPEGLHLVLQPDVRLSVHVVDDRGQPCADMPVSLAVVDRDNDLCGPFGSEEMARTDEHGDAVIPHLQQLQQQLRDDPPWDAGYRVTVRAMYCGSTDRGTPVSFAQLPTEPVVLRVPAFGAVRAQLRIGDRAVTNGTRFYLANAEDSVAWLSRRPDDRGWVRFPRVAIGKQYQMQSYGQASVRRQFAGPAARDQEVELILAPAPDAAQLRARLVDAKRQPLGNWHGTLRVSASRYRGAYSILTDAEGGFTVGLRSRAKTDEPTRLSLELSRKQAPTLRAELSERVLRAGIEDLGDITMLPGNALVAGRLVLGGEPYRGDIQVLVEQFDPNAEPPEWSMVCDQPAHTPGDGSFVVYADCDASRCRMTCRSPRTQPSEAIEFAPRARDVVVELRRGEALPASVLLPTGTPLDQLRLELVSAAPDHARHQAEDGGVQNERCALQWRSLPPGSYSFEVRMWCQSEPIVRVADVQVPPPAGSDVRLVDVDLRPFVRVATIAMTDLEGNAVTEEGAIFLGRQVASGDWVGVPLRWEDRVELALPPGPADLLIAASGHRPTPLRGTGDELSVRLLPWPTIAVTVADAPTLPPGTRMFLHCEAIDADTRTWHEPWGDSEPIAPLLGGVGTTVEVADGQADMPCGDGPQRLVLSAHNGDRQEFVQGITPGQVLSTAGRVTLRAPAAEWQRVIQRLTAPK